MPHDQEHRLARAERDASVCGGMPYREEGKEARVSRLLVLARSSSPAAHGAGNERRGHPSATRSLALLAPRTRSPVRLVRISGICACTLTRTQFSFELASALASVTCHVQNPIAKG